MKKKRIIAVLVIAVLALAGGMAYAFSGYGTQDDPLITKSYLDSILTEQIMAQAQEKLDAAESSRQGAFTVLTLTNGQTVTCEPGCEIMLRIGSAMAHGADSPVLVDTTSASSLEDGGALERNHLYMATITGNGITAASATVKVLICGSYTVN